MDCPKCGSNRIKNEEGIEDFLHVKREGEPDEKAKNCNKNKYFCWDCEYRWIIEKSLKSKI